MRTRLVPLVLALAASALVPGPAKAAGGGVWLPTLQATQAFDHLSAVGNGVYYAQYLDTYARSTDGGATWVTMPKPPGQYYGLPGIRFATKDVGYSLSGGPGIESLLTGDLSFQEEIRRCGGIMPLQRTTDGGTTWRAVCVPLSKLTSDPVFAPGAAPIGLADAGRTVVLTGSEVPRNPATPGTQDCRKQREVIYTSHDGGVRWTRAALPAGWHGGYRQYLLDKSTILRLTYGHWQQQPSPTECGSSTTGAFLSRDGGKSFRHLYTCGAPALCTSIAMPSRNRIILGHNDGSTTVTDDGGKRWYRGPRLFDTRWQPVVDSGELPKEAFWLQSMSFVDAKNGFASTRGSGTWRTTNGGRSWTQERSHECGWYIPGIGEIAAGSPTSAITGGPHFISARVAAEQVPQGCAAPPPGVPRALATDVVTTLPGHGGALAITLDGSANVAR